MSSFNCEHCGTAILDTQGGEYITECEHYRKETTNIIQEIIRKKKISILNRKNRNYIMVNPTQMEQIVDYVKQSQNHLIQNLVIIKADSNYIVKESIEKILGLIIIEEDEIIKL